MTSEDSRGKNRKQKAIHEFEQFIGISLYLALFFCAIATYRMILLNELPDWYINYGFALINALVIAKVILIGEYVHLGKKSEAKPLLISAVYKAFLFGLLAFALHHIEEVIKRLLHGEDVAGAFHDLRADELVARSVVIACAFIPLFAFRELMRVLGEDKLHDLFYFKGPKQDS